MTKIDTSEVAPVLVTSAIVSSAPLTALDVPADRLAYTLLALEKLIESGARTLVICDGSNFDLSPHVRYLQEKYNWVSVECLFFHNDAGMVRTRGKGYGEGEIINFAIKHSVHIAQYGHFTKCTSKLWVENFFKCVEQYNGRASFDYNGWLRPRKIDTRFYTVSTTFYSKVLGSAYLKVNDLEGYFLEHAFRDALSNHSLQSYLMLPPPIIRGRSGSMNVEYSDSKMIHVARHLRSILASLMRRSMK